MNVIPKTHSEPTAHEQKLAAVTACSNDRHYSPEALASRSRALCAIAKLVADYLPPDSGIDDHETFNEIIGIVEAEGSSYPSDDN